MEIFVSFKKSIVAMFRRQLNKRNRTLIATMPNLGRARHIDVFENVYTNEYIRLSTLELIAEEIARKQVEGSVAELGVYKGHFARRLNQAFPGRTLYLFDTFTGFDVAEEQADRERGLVHKRDFSDTNEQDVLRRMVSPSQCVVRKGLFPATAEGLERERFCFVSIDTDLYDPILAGLQFFYDRLSPGGYILFMITTTCNFRAQSRQCRNFRSSEKLRLFPFRMSMGRLFSRVEASTADRLAIKYLIKELKVVIRCDVWLGFFRELPFRRRRKIRQICHKFFRFKRLRIRFTEKGVVAK